MLTTNWQADVVIYEIFIFMPIYAIVLWSILIMRPRKSAFKTHYYTLVLSQGAADFCTVIIFITQMLPRYFNIGNALIWWLDDYGASCFYVNSGPQMFILRSIGLFLITVQRYATLCRHHGRLSHILSVTPAYTLILCHWLISIALHMPAVLICHAHFENAQSFFVITSEEHKKTSATIVICTFTLCGLSVAGMYCCIIRKLCSVKRTSSVTSFSAWQSRQNRYQEARLCIHVLFLAIISAATFAYYVFQAIYSDQLDQEDLRALRVWYPLVSGNMSFINPLMLLLLNRDIQNCFKNFCRGKTIDHRTSSVLAMNRTT